MSRISWTARCRATVVASIALSLFTGTTTAANAVGHERVVNLLTGRCLQADSYNGAVFTSSCRLTAHDLRALWEMRAIGRGDLRVRIYWSNGGCLAGDGEHSVAVSQSCRGDNSAWTRGADGKLVNVATGRCLTDERFGYVSLFYCDAGFVERQAWRSAVG